MAARRLRIELQGDPPGGPFVFFADGTFEPTAAPQWSTHQNPREVHSVLVTWSFYGLMAEDDRGTLFASWIALEDRFTRVAGVGIQPDTVTVIDDATDTVLYTIGPPKYERLQVDLIAADHDPRFPAANWDRLVRVRLQVTAEARYADTRGIVEFDLEVDTTHDPGGFETMTWALTLSTKEGTDAREKAREFGLIDIGPLGNYWSYLTNGPDGVEIRVLDADEDAGRIPTRVQSICRVKEWGSVVGATGPNEAPTEVEYAETESEEPDETFNTVRARAQGPGAREWVEARRPGGTLNEENNEWHEERREAISVWTFRKTKEKDPKTKTQEQTRIEVTGGAPHVDFETTAGGYRPLRFTGGVLAWTVTVNVVSRRKGGEGTRTELPFPGVFPLPLVLDVGASREDANPWVAEEGKDATQHVWQREATLVYRANQPPPADLMAALIALPTVDTYFARA